MLSGGMCLVAVNLPSLWLFFKKASGPKKIIHSARSFISSRSINSSNNSNSLKKKRGGSDPSDRVSQERIQLVKKIDPRAGGYEAYAMGDVDGREGGKGDGRGSHGPVPPEGRILVKESVFHETRRRETVHE